MIFMSNTHDLIALLPDQDAVLILKEAVLTLGIKNKFLLMDNDPSLVNALHRFIGEEEFIRISEQTFNQRRAEADLARVALQFLYEEPLTKKTIQQLLKPQNQSANDYESRKFDLPSTVTLITAILFILQTHIRVDKQSGKPWEILIEKKPVSDALLESLVKKLLPILSNKPRENEDNLEQKSLPEVQDND
jgi:hypothetical protein